MASKGARLTAQIALPGRALVHLPFIDRVFVSRRIEELAERDRLTALAESERRGPGGWIVRTAAEGTGDAAFARDAAYLRGLWAAIQERERGSGAPVLIHRDLNLAERLLRDVVSEGFQEVVVDSDRLRTLARDFLERYLPGLGVRVRVCRRSGALFDDMGIHQEIERAQAEDLAQERGLDRGEPDRGARGHRRQHGQVRRTAQPRGDGPRDQSRGGPRDRPAAAPA